MGQQNQVFSLDDFKHNVIRDYTLCYTSRQVSVLKRKEVLAGRARFSITGDGKELPQAVAAKYFQDGDFRCGYYRDQTLMMGLGLADVESLFAQIYGDPAHDPFSGGRQMNCHFSTPFVQENGQQVDFTKHKNSTADLGPVAVQVSRSLGIGLASKLFRQIQDWQQFGDLSNNGNEVCFCTIGDASTSEGHFWEAINAAGVLQIPVVFFVWDDGYGISVDKSQQTTKGSISEILAGFQKQDNTNGLNIRSVKGWDYAEMCLVFEEVIDQARTHHIPAVLHVEELTQPLGHSSSGSHERYKSSERLEWEKQWDCLRKMREWIVENEISTDEHLRARENEIDNLVNEAQQNAWRKFFTPIRDKSTRVTQLVHLLVQEHATFEKVHLLTKKLDALSRVPYPTVRNIARLVEQIRFFNLPTSTPLHALYQIAEEIRQGGQQAYSTHLCDAAGPSATHLRFDPVVFSPESLNANEVLNRYFDALFAHNPKVLALGEDVGKIGDVNRCMADLQQKYSAGRVRDTGIRELSIIGKGIGLALRGLRPIAEIQYLDYLLFGLEPLSDDAATTQYRTAGKQKCPLIIRTRGHRFIGIFHSGSPMQMMLGALRGIHLCVPRNMVQAIGMYNTALQINSPVLVIECLNGYRKKEYVPENLLRFSVPFGQPEILQEGTDITVVSYGSTLHLAKEAIDLLQEYQPISCELIDVQTLLPFDEAGVIGKSLQKTNKILFVDEDVPGGTTAFMLQKVIEEQNGYRYLDATPRTLSAKEHRPAYGSDGDYFSKPNTEDIIAALLDLYSE